MAAKDQADWGDHYAVLDIEYKCDTCGGSIYPHLPQTEDDLSKFVTEAIAARPAGGADATPELKEDA